MDGGLIAKTKPSVISRELRVQPLQHAERQLRRVRALVEGLQRREEDRGVVLELAVERL